MRMPLPALGLTVVVCIFLLVSRADGAPRAPSTVKLSRASQPEPVLRGRWRKRLYFRNIWTTRESADSYSRRQCIKKR